MAPGSGRGLAGGDLAVYSGYVEDGERVQTSHSKIWCWEFRPPVAAVRVGVALGLCGDDSRTGAGHSPPTLMTVQDGTRVNRPPEQ